MDLIADHTVGSASHKDLRKMAMVERRRLMKLVRKALGGDEAAIDELECRLPGDRYSSFPPLGVVGKRWPYSQACLGRDLALTGRIERGRGILIGAWSDCSLTTLMSLGGVRQAVKALDLVRPADPHIAQLTYPLKVWRGIIRGCHSFGMAWTTDQAMAKWFAEEYWAERFRLIGEIVVLERSVGPDDVLAVVGPGEGRDGESEIVLRPDGCAK